jgi:uncharacterized protein (TIGR03435 family)
LIGRHILDKTGLTGKYSFVLQWSKEQAEGGGMADPSNAIAEALREQLGLKLDAAKAPVAVVTIEKAERPAGN